MTDHREIEQLVKALKLADSTHGYHSLTDAEAAAVAAAPANIDRLATIAKTAEARVRELETLVEKARSLDTGRLAVRVDRAEAALAAEREARERAERERDGYRATCAKIAEQVDELAEDRVERNARIRDLLTRIERAEQHADACEKAMYAREDAEAATLDRAERAEEALREILRLATPQGWETPGHPMNGWTKREPIIRLARAALSEIERPKRDCRGRDGARAVAGEMRALLLVVLLILLVGLLRVQLRELRATAKRVRARERDGA